jgi:outer membrane protein
MKGVIGRACLLALGIVLCTPVAAAQRGDNVLQFGWLHLMPNSGSTALHTEVAPSLLGSLLGVQSSFDSPGTAASAHSADTVALIFTRFLSDHVAIQMVGGVPAHINITGQGRVAPTGLLGQFIHVDLAAAQNNPLVSVQEWTPAVLLQYHFGRSASAWHPYLGIGASYAWFSGYAPNGAFRTALQSNFGNLLGLASGHPGPTRIEVSASRSWNPVFNAGVSYDLSAHWGVAGSLSYAPLFSDAHIKVLAQGGAVLADSDSRLSQHALVSAVLLSYRFRL